MEPKIDWLPILLRCKENVLAHIGPLVKSQNGPQPDLGTGAGGDKTQLADVVAEKAIVEVLLGEGISFTLVSEESGVKEYGEKPALCYVTVDPIDGTTNLVRGLPFFCSSVAISYNALLSEVHTAMVSDLLHGDTYTAERGKGAFCDGKQISPTRTPSLDDAVVGIDLNTYKATAVMQQLSELIQETKYTRHFGANALELCYVAAGLTDAFVDIRGKLRTTDVAAAMLILKEAGGTLSTPQGQLVEAPLDPKQTVKFVASGNPQIHALILRLLTRK